VIRSRGQYEGRPLAIEALSQQEMEDAGIGEFGKHIVISITSPTDTREAQIHSAPKAILRVKFFDLDAPAEGYEEVFSRKDARQIRKFVERHLGSVGTIVVHCAAGISRSVGVAAALSKFLLGSDEEFYLRGRPNSRVYSMLMQELQKEMAVTLEMEDVK
jgi:protein-tyrosine phosphatase